MSNDLSIAFGPHALTPSVKDHLEEHFFPFTWIPLATKDAIRITRNSTGQYLDVPERRLLLHPIEPIIEALEALGGRSQAHPVAERYEECGFCGSPGTGLRCDSCGAPMPAEAK